MSRDTEALSKRYIYYPDHLVSLPSVKLDANKISESLGSVYRMLQTVLTEPVFTGAIPSLFHATLKSGTFSEEAYRLAQASVDSRFLHKGFSDVSVGEFFLQYVGRPDLIDNVLSALMHGVYGGDVWKLSMEQSMFQSLFLQDHFPTGTGEVLAREHDVQSGWDLLDSNEKIRQMAKDNASMTYIGFYNGFGTLTDALATGLIENPNVAIKTGVSSISYDRASKKVEVCRQSGSLIGFQYTNLTFASGYL